MLHFPNVLHILTCFMSFFWGTPEPGNCEPPPSPGWSIDKGRARNLSKPHVPYIGRVLLDMFHIFAEPFGNFSHLLLFLNPWVPPPPPHYTHIWKNFESFYLYLFSKFARSFHGSEERATPLNQEIPFSRSRHFIGHRKILSFSIGLYGDLKSFELLYRP